MPLLICMLFAPATAAAHHLMEFATPATFTQGLLSGLGHPLLGLDHLAYILLVALWAAVARKPLLVPAYFFAATVLGLMAVMDGFAIAHLEQAIAVCLIFGGLGLYYRRLVYAVCAFGFFHGAAFADGIIGAENTPIAAYLLGLAAVQCGLVAALASALNKLELAHHRWSHELGFGFAAVGALFLVG